MKSQHRHRGNALALRVFLCVRVCLFLYVCMHIYMYVCVGVLVLEDSFSHVPMRYGWTLCRSHCHCKNYTHGSWEFVLQNGINGSAGFGAGIYALALPNLITFFLQIFMK